MLAGRDSRLVLLAGLGGQAGLPGEVIDGCGVGAAGGCQVAARARGRGEGGQAGAQELVVEPGQEQGAGDSGVGDLVAEGAGNALDEAVHAQAAQVVGHLPRGDGLGGRAEELGHDRPQVAVGEAAGKKPEHAKRREERAGAGVAEPQAGGAGAGPGGDRLAGLGDDFLAVGGVVADLLDVEETPGGGEAGCPQRGQVLQPFADAEVARGR